MPISFEMFVSSVLCRHRLDIFDGHQCPHIESNSATVLPVLNPQLVLQAI